jgi:hypothetical protein
MSSLTDLRTTLDRHAEQVADEDAVIRTTAVRHRVAVVRRRRRAFGAGALAAALVAVCAVVLVSQPNHGAKPAAPVLLGVQAPETMTSLSYTYRTDGWGRTVTGDASVKIPASARPRLISWTVNGAPSVRFLLPNGDIWTSRATHFHDFVALPAGQSGSLRVSAGQGSVGLATYDLTDQAPPGYTRSGVTFRQTVATTPLLGALIGVQGQTDASSTFVAPHGDVGLAVSCPGLPDGDAVHVSFNGSERSEGGCDGSTSFDPGGTIDYTFSTKKPGELVALRAWVTNGSSATPLNAGAVPHLRLAVGVYGPVESQRLARSRVDTFVEYDGHLWRTAETAHQQPVHPGQVLSFNGTDFQGPAVLTWNTKGRTAVSVDVDGMPTRRGSFSGGKASLGGLWLPRGATAHVRLVRGTGSVGLARYSRVD